MTETKEKKVRTPRQPDSITAGALKLSLEGKVNLIQQLKDSIKREMDDLQAASTNAQELVASLNGNEAGMFKESKITGR